MTKFSHCLASLLLVTLLYLFPVPALASDPDVRGIDVSNNQGPVDWVQVKNDNLVFAFIKASDGIGYPEVSYFYNNWPKMKAAGLIRGAYHYYEPSDNPIAQANYFADVLEKAGGLQPDDLPPVLDIEQDGGRGTGITQDIMAFLKQLLVRTGRVPIIYVSPGFANPNFTDPALANYPLWQAQYDVGPPAIPRIWSNAGKNFTFWQYSDKGSRAGVNGNVDLDVFLGTLPQLKAFVRNSVVGAKPQTEMAKKTSAVKAPSKTKPTTVSTKTAKASPVKEKAGTAKTATSSTSPASDEIIITYNGYTARAGPEVSAARLLELIKALRASQ